MDTTFTIQCRLVLFAMLFCAGVVFGSACSRATRPAPSADAGRQNATTEVRVSDTAYDAAEPAIAADTNGNLYVVYVEHAQDKKADLYLQRFDAHLDRSGEKVRVNPEIGTVKSWRGDPPTVVIAPDKTVFVGWTRRNEAGGTNYMLSASRDGGESFSEPTKINDDDAPVSHGMHSLTVGKNGVIFAAWLDERNVVKGHGAVLASDVPATDGFHILKIDHKGPESARAPEPNSEVFFASSNDGGKTFSKNQRIAHDVCPCCKTAVFSTDDGRVYVSWRQVLKDDYRHIAVAALTDNGQSFSPGSIVSDDRWQIAACPVSGAAIYATPNTGLNVVWYTAGSAGQAGYYFAESTEGLEAFGPRLFVGGEAASGTPVLLGSDAGMTLVMPGSDDRVIIARQTPDKSSFSITGTIEHASVPAATTSGGATYIAFVRNENKKPSVWVAKH